MTRALSAVAALAATLALVAGAGASPAKPVRLAAAPSKAKFAVGQTVTIRATILAAAGRVGVATTSTGVLRVTAVRRNGRPVRPRVTPVVFDDSLAETIADSVKTLARGGRVRISLSSVYDGAARGEVLQSVALGKNDVAIASLYPLTAPGRYEVTLVYRYPAGARRPASVWAGATDVVRVRFTIA